MGNVWVTFHTLPRACCRKSLVSPLIRVCVPLNLVFSSDYPPIFPTVLRLSSMYLTPFVCHALYFHKHVFCTFCMPRPGRIIPVVCAYGVPAPAE